MNLVTWDPFRDLNLLQGDVNRLFDRFGADGSTGDGGRERRWTPALDIHEETDGFVVRCDLPGMREEDVTIEVDDRVLRIAGERESGHALSGDGYHRLERPFGRFERVLHLPEGVNADAIRASFDRGVLQLQVPKPEQVQPRRIRIGGGTADAIEGASSERHDDARVDDVVDKRMVTHA